MQLAIRFLAILLLSLCGSVAQAQDVMETPLEPDVDENALIDDVEKGLAVTVLQSDKWIGVLCRPVDEVLRQHLQLPPGAGLVVEQVVPQSPAARAGIQTGDILTQLDGEQVTSLDQLVAQTAQAGDAGILVSIIRDGKAQRDPIAVHPEKRPAGAGSFRAVHPPTGNDLDSGRLREWLDKLQGGQILDDGQLRFRFFGPGVPVPQKGQRTAMSTSIEIRRENDEPAKIKVTKDGTTWEVTEDQLDQLPEDVRAAVRNALGQGGGIQGLWIEPRDESWPKMNERLDEMRQQMQKMLEELHQLREHQAKPEGDSIDA